MNRRELKSRVNQWITDHHDQILKFCCDLLACKSVTGDELPIQRDVLLPFLRKEMQWDAITLVGSDPEQERPNINAVMTGRDPIGGLLFNGHVDVVDVPENQLARWTKDPWHPLVEEGCLYGRGANDMKGGVACMVWAAKALMDWGIDFQRPLAVELVIGEEGGDGRSHGTTAATKALLAEGYRFGFSVDPEPTNCEIHTVSAGTFIFEVTIPGKEVHTSMRNLVLYPQRYGIPSGYAVGVDAVAKLIDILKLFEKLERQWVHRWRHPVLGSGGYLRHEDAQGVGCFTINPSFIEGGTYIASVPGYAKARLQCYYSAWLSQSDVVKEIKQVVDAYASIDDWLRLHPPEFSVTEEWPPYNTDVNHSGCQGLYKAWEEATGRVTQFSGFKAVDARARPA